MGAIRRLALCAFGLAFGAGPYISQAWGAKTYPGCDTLKDSEFRMVTLATRSAHALEEPLKMAFDMDAQGRVDVYFVERKGKLRKYRGADKQVVTLGSVQANTDFEGGLSGIALDPAFKANRRLYLYYGHGAGSDFRFRVSRFTLDGQGMLDPGSEKAVLAIPAGAGLLHTGGAMLFDKDGNLYITVGDNAAGERGPGNTNDLRGKILRIKPIPFSDAQTPAPGAGSTYTLPEGNLFPGVSNLTRPEIYVMGTRNAYSLGMDPVRGLIAWGDVGPDGKGTTEEHNVAKGPGNFGYPFFAGNQVRIAGTGTPAAPVNNHAGNTGLVNLPPAIPATHAYAQAAAITGPIYRYNPSLASAVKFPPHFEGMWFVTDFNRNTMDTILLDGAGTAKVASGQVFRNLRLDRPLDFQQGPDGALYVINYSGWFSATATTSILRLEYLGDCRPGPTAADFPHAPVPGRMRLRGNLLAIEGIPGKHALRILDARGRLLATFQGHGPGRYDLSRLAGGKPGLLVAELSVAGRTRVESIPAGM